MLHVDAHRLLELHHGLLGIVVLARGEQRPDVRQVRRGARPRVDLVEEFELPRRVVQLPFEDLALDHSVEGGHVRLVQLRRVLIAGVGFRVVPREVELVGHLDFDVRARRIQPHRVPDHLRTLGEDRRVSRAEAGEDGGAGSIQGRIVRFIFPQHLGELPDAGAGCGEVGVVGEEVDDGEGERVDAVGVERQRPLRRLDRLVPVGNGEEEMRLLRHGGREPLVLDEHLVHQVDGTVDVAVLRVVGRAPQLRVHVLGVLLRRLLEQCQRLLGLGIGAAQQVDPASQRLGLGRCWHDLYRPRDILARLLVVPKQHAHHRCQKERALAVPLLLLKDLLFDALQSLAVLQLESLVRNLEA
mmetsp:Transcript_53914/g.128137  ORF Transcript_53914/g.128137 Transcript_53914/m.128137 type:complete len:356 (+) Transcript_53914:2778-3845(+)